MNSSEYIKSTSREYSIYVCENRAIPRVNDGLKDSQRKALWTIRKKADKIKVISLAGEMISSNLYLHGDASAADAISRLAGPFINNVPLLEGKGAFGSRVDPIGGIGAPRYVYVKKSKATEKLIFQDLDIVDTKENYDGSNVEPETFLPIIPTVLLNGISGIAVGWATEILPRSLEDLIEATKLALKGEKIPTLKPHYKYLNVDVEQESDPELLNTWYFTGKFERLDSSTLKITELPPELSLEKLKKNLIALEDVNKIRDWTDKSTKFIDVTVKFKRGELAEMSDEQIIKTFKLKGRNSERIVVLDWDGKSIRQYKDPTELVKDFVEWRFGIYVKRYEKKLEDTLSDLLFWRCFKKCFDNDLPKVFTNINSKKDLEIHIENSIGDLFPTKDIIQKISSMPSYNWTKDKYEETKSKILELEKDEKYFNSLLSDHTMIKDIYANELSLLSGEKF